MNKTRRPKTTDLVELSLEEVVVPHLAAAFRVARWILRNENDPQDVVQEASLRAFRYFHAFSGGDGRAWFLRIARNTSIGWRRQRRATGIDVFDEQHHRSTGPDADPEALLLRRDEQTMLSRALDNLPNRFRRLLVLRAFDGLSYPELADQSGIPIGTVMSRLSRAREALRGAFHEQVNSSGTCVTMQTAEPEAEERCWCKRV